MSHTHNNTWPRTHAHHTLKWNRCRHGSAVASSPDAICCKHMQHAACADSPPCPCCGARSCAGAVAGRAVGAATRVRGSLATCSSVRLRRPTNTTSHKARSHHSTATHSNAPFWLSRIRTRAAPSAARVHAGQVCDPGRRVRDTPCWYRNNNNHTHCRMADDPADEEVGRGAGLVRRKRSRRHLDMPALLCLPPTPGCARVSPSDATARATAVDAGA